MDAFGQLAGAHADRLFAVLLRLLGNRSEAEDVAQEVMLRAWRGIGRFHGRSLFFTWLYRIAINEANRSLERSARRPVSVSIDAEVLHVPADARDEPSRRLEQTELRNALNKALPGLPPDYRMAIVLR
jgi:RNA polymerase sigma-70 factor (ECF subfamily)